MKPLFIGQGNSAVAWYRCGLPANALDYDWVGVAGTPDKHYFLSGNTESVNLTDNDYDTIIVQEVHGEKWLDLIKKWQAEGKRIIYEIDDFVHGIWKIEAHRNREHFSRKTIKEEFVPCMKQADEMICSTEFLSDQYKKYNPNQHVCLVGIDTARYNVEFPSRDDIIIGWAGGTGHHHSVGPWLEEVSKILALYDNVKFVSIGTRYGEALAQRHLGKAISVPWSTLENYPYVLTNMDVALAPAHDSKYYKSKSDLRWLEASAVGLPVIANPLVYKEIEDESTGLLAETPEQAGDLMMELIEDESLRKEIGKKAQKYVQENRDIKEASKQWNSILNPSP